MLFLLGLFLGFVIGIIVAGLCNAAREKAPDIRSARSPEVMKGAA
jgi:hypothetical protein